jgi:hypothetical protein
MSAKAGAAAIADPNRRVRRHPRYRCNFPVTVTLFAGDSYRRLGAHCRDLSRAGMGILVAEELTPGDVVSLNFCFPGSAHTWEIRAIVRHRRGYHYGIEFVTITKELGKEIREFAKGLDPALEDGH